MKPIIAKAGGTILVVGFLVMLVLGFLAYSVTSQDPATNIWYDGLGRPLSDSPAFVRYFFGADRKWAGWTWFIGDLVVFWGWIALGILFSKRTDLKEKQTS